LANEANLADFLQTEPHAAVVPVVEQWTKDFPATPADGGYDVSEDEMLNVIGTLAESADESVLIGRTLKAVRALGCRLAYFFLVEKDTEGEPSSLRILIPASTGLAQTYVKRRWYATDPFLIHAAKSQQAFFSSDVGLLKNLNGSQREMGEFVRQMGSGSWIVIPAHNPESTKFGVLYASHAILPHDGGEEPLRFNRLLYKLLSSELFDWFINREKSITVERVNLLTSELEILDALARGTSPKVIAEAQGISMFALTRYRYRSINAKLKTKTITDAIRIAGEYGLLALASERKIGYVAFRPKYGIFLCEDFGCPVWSYMSQGVNDAHVFPDATAARKFMNRQPWGTEAELYRVEIHHLAKTATIEECVKVGLPAWDVWPLTSEGLPDDSSTWGSLTAKRQLRLIPTR
jgi:DNA-binding CsgD family transcriptional regulator